MGLKRKIVASGETSQLVENRALKVVRVNPSISIQPKKPTSTIVTTTSQTTLRPGFTIKTTQAATNATTKTVVVTNPNVTTNADLLKKQLEASQKMVEQFKEQLRQQEMENARLKLLLENGS